MQHSLLEMTECRKALKVAVVANNIQLVNTSSTAKASWPTMARLSWRASVKGTIFAIFVINFSLWPLYVAMKALIEMGV